MGALRATKPPHEDVPCTEAQRHYEKARAKGHLPSILALAKLSLDKREYEALSSSAVAEPGGILNPMSPQRPRSPAESAPKLGLWVC